MCTYGARTLQGARALYYLGTHQKSSFQVHFLARYDFLKFSLISHVFQHVYNTFFDHLGETFGQPQQQGQNPQAQSDSTSDVQSNSKQRAHTVQIINRTAVPHSENVEDAPTGKCVV